MRIGGDVDDLELPRITSALLRDHRQICPRRLGGELAARLGNRHADRRFRLGNAVEDAARLAHTTLGPPDPAALVVPPGLEPEERSVFVTATSWYRALFQESVRSAPTDGWETPVPEAGVRLVGPAGLLVEGPGGTQLRKLFLRPLPPGPILGRPDVRFALLRVATRVGSRRVTVIDADLLGGVRSDADVDVGAARPELLDWLADHVRALSERALTASVRPGHECARCRFVAGCPAHP